MRGWAGRTRRAAGTAAVLVVAATSAAGLAPTTAGAVAVQTATAARPTAPASARSARVACPTSPFTPGFASFLAATWPRNRFTAQVDDAGTGCSWSLQPDLRITTASVEKAEILAGVLLRAQAQSRGLTSWEAGRIWPMITQSDNPAADALWSYLGGVGGMQAVDRAFGLTDTTQASPWGLTSTSARDRNRVMQELVLGLPGPGGRPSPLGPSYRDTARSYLLSVTPSQRWGITAGAPPGASVPLKNGFFPSTCCGWRINSSGVVQRRDGDATVVTILSDGWGTEQAGIDAVNLVSRVIAAATEGPFAPFASPGMFVDRQWRDIVGRAATFPEWLFVTEGIGWSNANAPGVIAGLLAQRDQDPIEDTILRLYLGGLNHPPDGPNFARWAWLVRTGQATLLDVGQAIGEVKPWNGGPDGDFVDRISYITTGAFPSAADRQTWVDLMAHGLSRGAVLAFFTSTPSFRYFFHNRVMISLAYLKMLHRGPDPDAFGAWTRRLDAGAPFTDLVGSIYRSDEYTWWAAAG